MPEELARETWAIHTGTRVGGFLGVYMFERDLRQPDAQSGFTIATFHSHDLAQQSLDDLKSKQLVTFPEARVCRIKIIIEEV